MAMQDVNKHRGWVVRIFVGEPDEVAHQLEGYIDELDPRSESPGEPNRRLQQIYDCNGVAVLKISTGGPVDGQLAVTVCAFVDGKI